MWIGEEDTPAVASASAELFQRRFVLLAEMSSDGVCVHQDGRVVYANAAAIRWMGVDPAAGLVGRRVAEFVHPDSYPAVERRLRGLRRTGDSAPPSELVMGRPEKPARDVQATSTRIEWDGQPAVVTNFRDLTAVKVSEVQRSQAALLDHVSDAVIGVSTTGAVTSWNAAAEHIYRRSAEQALHLPVHEAVGAPLDAERVLRRGGMQHTTHFAADGSPLSVRVSSARTDSGYVVICADLTALRRAERHFEAVVTAIDAGIVVFSSDGAVESANPTARRLLNALVDATTPFGLDVPIVDTDGIRITADRHPVRQTAETGAPQIDRVIGVAHDGGNTVWLSLTVRLLGPDHPGHSPVLCSFVDVTAQTLARARLAHAAGHDALTGLPNRSTALTRITGSLAPGADLRAAAILFIDMDDMKVINDSHGHGAGDAVLVTAATRMSNAVRAGDVIARLAGDEFVVMLVAPIDRPDLDRVVTALHHAASEPIHYLDAHITATSSIGVTIVEADDARNALELLRAADDAMYAAKALGPGRTRYA